MAMLNISLSGALAVAVGAISFFKYFHIGEHHMHGMLYVQTFFATCTLSVLTLVHFLEYGTYEASALVATLAGAWLVGVYGSCLIWRAFFNPLNRFPGPWMARISKFYTSHRFRNLDAYYIIAALHAQYGPFVRLGPNDLSIIDPDAMQLAYGPDTTVTKSQWYDAGAPHHSMHTTRDKSVHDRRRRFWAPAFSDKALREYEVTLQRFNDKLRARLDEFQGGSVNVTKWFNLWSFDIMTSLSFGKDYGMLDSGERHWALDLLTQGMEAGGAQPPMWLFRFVLAVPGLAAGYHKFLRFCADELRARVVGGGGQKGDGEQQRGDIIGWLLKAYKDHPHPEEDIYLQGDTRLIIVAGSDTTAATMTYLCYHLAREPAQVEQIREELRPLTTGDAWSDKDIQHAQHLNGAINEALRLHPPVPSGISRKTAPQGLQIGDVHVPGNVQFIIPQYPMGRDEAIYTEAEAFVPERWYSRPEMIKHPDAFAPFSMGPFNCIGKNLARMELRTMTAQLVLNYDIAFAAGEDGARLLNETHDHFTLTLGQLDLLFKPISG